MNKKGITPVIAIVLLLMMTVSSAAAAYYWMTTIQSNLQQQAQGAISSTGLGGGYGVSALSGSTSCVYSSSGYTNITTYITITGSNQMPAGDWYAFVVDSTGKSIGTWKMTGQSAVTSGNTQKIEFTNTTATTSSNNISIGNVYTITINSPKGTSATTSCTGS
jgi:flagellin-like protein